MSLITTGWLARHTPQGTGGRQAALIDIAQDLTSRLPIAAPGLADPELTP